MGNTMWIVTILDFYCDSVSGLEHFIFDGINAEQEAEKYATHLRQAYGEVWLEYIDDNHRNKSPQLPKVYTAIVDFMVPAEISVSENFVRTIYNVVETRLPYIEKNGVFWQRRFIYRSLLSKEDAIEQVTGMMEDFPYRREDFVYISGNLRNWVLKSKINEDGWFYVDNYTRYNATTNVCETLNPYEKHTNKRATIVPSGASELFYWKWEKRPERQATSG